MEEEIDWQLGALICSDESIALVCCGVEGAEPKGDAFVFSTFQPSPLVLRCESWPKNKIPDTSNWNGFLSHGGQAKSQTQVGELHYVGRAWSRVTAVIHWKKSVEIVWVSDYNASSVSHWGLLGTSHWEETPAQTQNLLGASISILWLWRCLRIAQLKLGRGVSDFFSWTSCLCNPITNRSKV